MQDAKRVIVLSAVLAVIVLFLTAMAPRADIQRVRFEEDRTTCYLAPGTGLQCLQDVEYVDELDPSQ